ncbi:hypothetical protein TOPH_01338 [Tolypocladium ophioglossoides CBS 100239]|uniref:Uncharacterized protein n=1 Tax=Tolypocladium ophioglossoides (strain CBS 100239) TaxID=1163406 RepID=A0A0L0NKF9_TOLOC|nr:hypothetical protein TOPH_01338 [Tolypocladium ophioglossoides CBS 100239]
MIGALWASEPVEAKPRDEPSPWSLRLKALLVFFTHRVWRGGPRFLLQITACLLAILLLAGLAPSRFGDGYRDILSWTSAKTPQEGALRIVVFGSQDLVGSSADSAGARTTWTEQLCGELKCSSLLSFVPNGGSRPGLTSNGLYGNELHVLEQQMNTTDLSKSPASNYGFVLEQYPSGEDLVVALASHLFTQIELLYRKSLNPASIAFSDFWSNTTKSEIDRLAGPNAADRVDQRELESFRVVVPELFDITLTPGWQRRPASPAPHSKAEQMRNAGFLTKRWNSQIKAELESWKAKGRARPEGIEEEGIKETIEVPRTGSILEYLPSVLRPQRGQKSEADKDGDIVYAPYPRRAGVQANSTGAILDAMTEEEMQRSGLRDGKGRGTLSINDTMRFVDVWTPCAASTVGVVGVERGPGDEGCLSPDDHLFHDAFTVGQRAIDALAQLTATQISKDLFISR